MGAVRTAPRPFLTVKEVMICINIRGWTESAAAGKNPEP